MLIKERQKKKEKNKNSYQILKRDSVTNMLKVLRVFEKGEIKMSCLNQVTTLEVVVDLINNAKEGNANVYRGGYDIRNENSLAAEFAYIASEDFTLDRDTLSANLEYLLENGADFDFEIALEIAEKLVKEQD